MTASDCIRTLMVLLQQAVVAEPVGCGAGVDVAAARRGRASMVNDARRENMLSGFKGDFEGRLLGNVVAEQRFYTCRSG